MFESIRTSRRWIMVFLMVLVFPSFIASGVYYSYTRFVENDSGIARVGGQPISEQELDIAQRLRIEQMVRRFGQKIDPKMFDTPQVRAATLDELLAERALDQEAVHDRVIYSDTQLAELYRTNPAFQDDGKFSMAKKEEIARANGVTAAGLDELIRRDERRRLLRSAVGESAFLPKEVTGRLQRLLQEQREIAELRFDAAAFMAKVTISDDAVRAYYDAHAKDFEIPESVRAEYVMLTLADVAARLSAPEGEIKASYEQNVAPKFKQREEARAKAEALLAQVKKAPANFSEVARANSQDPGSAGKGGDLGFFHRGMMVKPFEDAAFALKPGALAPSLVETQFGFHIMRLDKIRKADDGTEERSVSHILIEAPEAKSFEQARPELEDAWKKAEAQKRYIDAAEQFTNISFEQSDSLKPVADKLALKVRTVEKVVRTSAATRTGVPPVFNARVVQALFSDDAVQKKRNIEAIEVSPNTLVTARVLEHHAATQPPLAAVTAQIRDRLQGEEATKLARAAGLQKLAELVKLADDAGFATPHTVARAQPQGLAAAALNEVMRAPGDKLPVYVGAESGPGYTIFHVLSAKMPAVDATKAEAANDPARGFVQQAAAADDLAYMNAVKEKNDAVVLSPQYRAGAVGQKSE